MVIDGDGHCNEPRDLFDRYLEKEFRDRGPKVVDAGGLRWMIEGKFLPRPVGTWGHGSSSGFFGTSMAAKRDGSHLSIFGRYSGQTKRFGQGRDRHSSRLSQHYGHGLSSR